MYVFQNLGLNHDLRNTCQGELLANTFRVNFDRGKRGERGERNDGKEYLFFLSCFFGEFPNVLLASFRERNCVSNKFY